MKVADLQAQKLVDPLGLGVLTHTLRTTGLQGKLYCMCIVSVCSVLCILFSFIFYHLNNVALTLVLILLFSYFILFYYSSPTPEPTILLQPIPAPEDSPQPVLPTDEQRALVEDGATFVSSLCLCEQLCSLASLTVGRGGWSSLHFEINVL